MKAFLKKLGRCIFDGVIAILTFPLRLVLFILYCLYIPILARRAGLTIKEGFKSMFEGMSIAYRSRGEWIRTGSTSYDVPVICAKDEAE